jgi:antitoxin CptB
MDDVMSESGHQSDPLRRARLRWRARRGLLENDLIFERFFSRYEHDLSDADVGVLTQLLELSDNDLMDLLLARKEPDGELASQDMTRVLGMLRSV